MHGVSSARQIDEHTDPTASAAVPTRIDLAACSPRGSVALSALSFVTWLREKSAEFVAHRRSGRTNPTVEDVVCEDPA